MSSKASAFYPVPFVILSWLKLQEHQDCQDVHAVADCLRSGDMQASTHSDPPPESPLKPLFGHVLGCLHLNNLRELITKSTALK